MDDLREQIAHALMDMDCADGVPMLSDAHYYQRADAVLAVLPTYEQVLKAGRKINGKWVPVYVKGEAQP